MAMYPCKKHSAYYYRTATPGDLVTFDAPAALPILDGTFDITAVQSGTGDPSPTNVRPISGFTGMNISRTGKNLLPNKTYQQNANTLRLGTDSLDGTLTYPAGTYTLSVKTEKAGNLVYTPSGGSSVSITTSTIDGKRVGTFTLTETTELFFHINLSGGITSEDVSDLQLEIGNYATSYDPYSATTYPVTWTSEGTIYGGYVKVKSDGSAELWKTWESVDMGDLEYTYDSSYTRMVADILDKERVITPRTGAVKCEIYQCIDDGRAIANVPDLSVYCSGLSVYFKDTNYTDADIFTGAVTGKKLIYPLAAPVKVADLTGIEVKTIIGENNIFTDTGAVEALRYRIK